ncbi:hypothetical protein HD806DRAFT_23229 [Xylariaceae sp. AK1471]|nr:hypothetical protein HD806DRAFT_23229 [Xylariaceae sp. AK1471]
MLDVNDYTVGWICAVEVELVAAQELLDEEHDTVDVPVNDNNTYTLGRIGQHNVVIASLPHWQYGLVSAANVARDMVRSFPNVRVGLMVGIGGGAPSKRHDIRLGDVVVSSPGYGTGGVLQYDYGRTIQGGKFETTGHLNQPPQLLLTALSTLKAQYSRKGHEIDKAIQTICKNSPRLRSRYCRPDSTADRLYIQSCIHIDADDVGCATSCDNDSLVIRRKRTEIEDDPTIHYGLIASGNQLIKDAEMRDKLGAEKDVLCFEMEAAGLMNHFPCIVMRGICDYADTHKNEAWQGYAAMTAAVYAKDLLRLIHPNRVAAEKRLCDVVSELQGDVRQTKATVEALHADTHFDRIKAWFSPPDPSTNFNSAAETRHEGSGNWFLQHERYLNWKSSRNSVLWLHGIPGCGKTILSSTIIKDLTSDTGCAQKLLYFYFDFSDDKKQHLEGAVRSLVSQLYHERHDVRWHLDSLYEPYKKNDRKPPLESICSALQAMIENIGEVWVVLDGLDECKEDGREQLLAWIRSLHDSQVNTHLLATSRQEQDIKSAFEGWIRTNNSITIQGDLIYKDIKAYIATRLQDGSPLYKRWRLRPDVLSNIEAELSAKADGMFRWVACQLDVLEKCYSPRDIRDALANLPKTLDETYSRILGSIPTRHKDTAKRILQFLTFSEHPLLLEEVVDAIAVDMSLQKFDPGDRMPVPEEVSIYCSSLIVIARREVDNYGRQGSWVEIRLAHLSVQEYLVSNRLDNDLARDFEVTIAKASIAKVCLVYLLYIGNRSAVDLDDDTFALECDIWAPQYDGKLDKLEQSYPLARLCLDSKSFEISRRLDGTFRKILPRPTPLFHASSTGLVQLVEMLLKADADTKTLAEQYGWALQKAAESGNESITRLLIDHGADVNAQDHYYRAIGQNSATHRLLSGRGSLLNRHKSALQAAAERGFESIVRLLISQGADVNAQAGLYGTALQASVTSESESVARLLINHGADINTKTRSGYGTAFLAAVYHGSESLARLLIDHGADVNTRGQLHTALRVAVDKGFESVTQLLIEKGADINAHNVTGLTILEAALRARRKSIVQILLAKEEEELINGNGECILFRISVTPAGILYATSTFTPHGPLLVLMRGMHSLDIFMT